MVMGPAFGPALLVAEWLGAGAARRAAPGAGTAGSSYDRAMITSIVMHNIEIGL